MTCPHCSSSRALSQAVCRHCRRISTISRTLGAYSLDRQDALGANAEVLDEARVQLVDVREALPVLPEELDQLQLRYDANNIGRALFRHQDPVHPAAKDLDGLGQVGGVGKRDQRLLSVAHLLHISQRYRLALAALLRQLVEGCDIFFVGVCEADYEQQVRVEIAVVEGPGRVARVLAVAEQDNVGGAVLDEKLYKSTAALLPALHSTYIGRVFDAGVVLGKAHQAAVYNLAQVNGPPVAPLELQIPALGRWVI
jgi:hypothetical protein